MDGVVGATEWAAATPYMFRSVRSGTERSGSCTRRPPLSHRRRERRLPPASPPRSACSSTTTTTASKSPETTRGLRARIGTGGANRSIARRERGPSHYNDSARGGTNETTGVANNSGNNQIVFELRHPLCSADRDTTSAHPWARRSGQVPVRPQHTRRLRHFTGPDLFDPSNNWADLILAANDVTPPTVSITAPTAASVLRGTVSVTADASDNVGVTSVDFRYFGGSPHSSSSAPTPRPRIPRRSTPPRSRTRESTPRTSKPSPTTRPATRRQRPTRSRSTTRRRAGSRSRAIAPEIRRSTR